MESGNGAEEAARTGHARTPPRRPQCAETEDGRDEEKAESQKCAAGLISNSAKKIST